MTDSVVVEGYAKFRDGKKWKTRWLVLRKPSPVADCLLLLVYKDKPDKTHGNKERASVTLEDICGLEAGQWYEGVAFTLAVLCLNQAIVLGFDSKEALQAWDIRLRYSLGEVHRFNVGVLPGTKLECGPATLHLCNSLLALARDVPPLIIGHWNLPDLRRYGPVPNGFVFEGGTRCGYWAGVFLLASTESEQISFLFDCIVRGISPTRGPFGLRPVLPDPSATRGESEERLNHEAQELEKRLSMLSHRSSTASSTFCPSAGGDDRSISGSSDTSDTSQSDCSIGSRLAIWTEPVLASNPAEGGVVQSGAKTVLQIVEKLPVIQGGGARPPVKAPRQLQEIGRQSSADSGIATGSHSSYSGSFSSYTGSLDIAPGEDFGSVFNLPPHLAQDLSPCTCPPVTGHEYQVPTSLRYLYDTPRSLLQEGSGGAKDGEPRAPTQDSAGPLSLATESAKAEKSNDSESTERQTVTDHLQSPSEVNKKAKVAPSTDSQHPESLQTCSSVTSVSRTILTICSVCGGLKLAVNMTFVVVVRAPRLRCRPLFGVRTTNGPTSRLFNKFTSQQPAALDTATTSNKWDNVRSQRFSDSGHTSSERETKTNLYESMSSVLWDQLRSGPCHDRNPQQDKVIYENCYKCQSERCRPPPRVTPGSQSGQRSFDQAMPSETHLKKSPEHDDANEEPRCQARGHGSQMADEQRPFEEINDTVISEDKKLHSKEERRRGDPTYAITDSRTAERNSEAEEKTKYELKGSYGQRRGLHETEGAVFVFPPEAPVAERPRSEAVTYVNIPISPTSKKQLNYMELELQEPGPGARGTSSTRYAHIDIAATETAHKVGTQHALGREEGLHTLELRRKGAPQ
ncbi:protein Dok-7 [Genypterus blacodes]|uniref:protein Dok-7 n=1 Tax=Genypterus blacodes TaxID=154954 RepID=UPI003F759284